MRAMRSVVPPLVERVSRHHAPGQRARKPPGLYVPPPLRVPRAATGALSAMSTVAARCVIATVSSCAASPLCRQRGCVARAQRTPGYESLRSH